MSDKQSQLLKVVTQNIWGKGDLWQERADAIGQNMHDMAVDVLCIQESSPDHFDYLKRHSFRHFKYAFYAPSNDVSVTPRPAGLAIFSQVPIAISGKVDLGREAQWKNPWMRIVQYVKLELPTGQYVSIFNTHLFLSPDQMLKGIQGCVDVMKKPQFADSARILTGDFNINLDTQHELLTPLADQQFVDVWRAKNGDSLGYTDPYAFNKTLAKRIDGFFVQRDKLDSVIGISLVNKEPVNSGNLLLSDHIGVMATFDFSCQQRR